MFAYLDHFLGRGGTAVDTAYRYGGGTQETWLGEWIGKRGVRDEVAIITKGGHTPDCDPASVDRQLRISLDRLGTDRIDLYLLHRDNLQIPVAEFVGVLEEHRAAGRLRGYGASNWSLGRYREGEAPPGDERAAGFRLLSNHMSLAEQLDLPWPGCEHVSDRPSIGRLEAGQTPLLAWASVARGFFSDPGADRVDEAELTRCWATPANLERRRRARRLAAERNVSTAMVALAYVLNQPFPTWAVFGPGSLDEIDSAAAAAELALTPEEIAWLRADGADG
jgi:aryl-alcohol dehydrogenase-like predicted oxidoreductase